jgi:plastocyanin
VSGVKRFLAVGVVALAVAGCGGGGGSGSSSTPTAAAPASTAPASTAPASGGSTAKVSMKNIAFNPQTVTVSKGTTVVWTNDDSVNHDVTKKSGPGPDFSSGNGNLAGGDTYKQTFNTAGTINYVCTIHPGMTGKIVVK